jgi:hypothetical protein
MSSIKQLMKEALSLSSASRSLLTEKLVESLEFDVDETVQNLGTTEAKKREHLKVPKKTVVGASRIGGIGLGSSPLPLPIYN